VSGGEGLVRSSACSRVPRIHQRLDVYGSVLLSLELVKVSIVGKSKHGVGGLDVGDVQVVEREQMFGRVSPRKLVLFEQALVNRR